MLGKFHDIYTRCEIGSTILNVTNSGIRTVRSTEFRESLAQSAWMFWARLQRPLWAV